jgi:hypothetical protein
MARRDGTLLARVRGAGPLPGTLRAVTTHSSGKPRSGAAADRRKPRRRVTTCSDRHGRGRGYAGEFKSFQAK